MANHCEKLVKKLTDKYFKPAPESSSSKSSTLYFLSLTINNFRKGKAIRDEIRRVNF